MTFVIALLGVFFLKISKILISLLNEVYTIKRNIIILKLMHISTHVTNIKNRFV